MTLPLWVLYVGALFAGIGLRTVAETLFKRW